MRELNEYTAEVRERVEIRSRTARQQRVRMLAICVPLVLCLVVGALTLPPMLRRAHTGKPERTETPDALLKADRTGDASANGEDGTTPLTGGLLPSPGAESEQMDGSPALEDPPADGVDAALPTIPSDFEFRFVWGCYGISSYDSETGKLVKTTDATHPEDYVTTLVLTEQQRTEIRALLSDLVLEDYPESYDPYNDPSSDTRMASEPNRDLVLTLRADGWEKTVTCRGICLGSPGLRGYDEKAQAFLDACEGLTAILQGTPEWQALPDYEFYYE